MPKKSAISKSWKTIVLIGGSPSRHAAHFLEHPTVMFTKRRNVSIYAIVTLWFSFSPASSLAPGIEGRSTQNGTSNPLSYDPSSCRPISGPNPWALGLSLGTVINGSGIIAGDDASQTSSSWQQNDGSTILQLNPDPSINGSAPFGVGSQCETKAVLDFSKRPQDGGTIRTPSLSLPALDAASYWLSAGFSNTPVYGTYWNRNRGAIAWTKTTLRGAIPSTRELDFEVAGDIAFDFSLPPSVESTTGEIALFMIKRG